MPRFIGSSSWLAIFAVIIAQAANAVHAQQRDDEGVMIPVPDDRPPDSRQAESEPSSASSTQLNDNLAEVEEVAPADGAQELAPKPRQFPSSKSPATNRIDDRPEYLADVGRYIQDERDWSWLDFGIEQRTRFELRDDFYRAGLRTDDRFLMRSRGFLGVRKVLDPFRFGFEFEDARRLGSELPENTLDIDETELIQAFGELYFDDVFGDGQPLSFRAGRMSFDAVDRRLFARNRFRNVTNAFDGFRIRAGDARSPWELDVFAFQPVARRERQFDHGDEERWVYGVNGYWRGWSPYITLEPYYFILDEDRDGRDTMDREIHTLGLHGFGLVADTGFDYDFNVAFQFGDTEDGHHRAFAAHAELGYTFEHQWKPRVAAMFNYASGDDDANDHLTQQFDPLFGAAHTFYGFSDNFGWQNMINPALYLSLRPDEKLRIEGFYRTYWLASDNGPFVRAGIVDADGRSGDFVCQELDLRMRYKFDDHLSLDMGYAYFIPGDFVRNAIDSCDDSDFFYVQLTSSF